MVHCFFFPLLEQFFFFRSSALPHMNHELRRNDDPPAIPLPRIDKKRPMYVPKDYWQALVSKILRIEILIFIIFASRFMISSYHPEGVLTKHYIFFRNMDAPISFYIYNFTLPDQARMCRGTFCDPNAQRSVQHTWLFEPMIHKFLNETAYSVDNPYKADVFYVPIYFGAYNLHRKKADFELAILPNITNDWPFYNRYGGVDHIFIQLLFSHNKIPITPQVQMDSPAMITLGDILHNYSITQPREAWRHTVMPYSSNIDDIENETERFIPLFYIGQNSIGHFDPRARIVRAGLAGELENVNSAISIVTRRNDPLKSAHNFNISEFMAHSAFCPVPHGDGPASKRLYDSYRTRCIPIVYTDEIRFPFEDVFANYRGTMVQMPMDSPQSAPVVLGMFQSRRQQRELRARIAELAPLLRLNYDGTSTRGDQIWGWLWMQYFKAATVAASKRRGLLVSRYL